MSDVINPCISCGACCAHFRVSFYWAETDAAGGTVPTHMTEQLPPFRSCMQGTNQKQSRCIALKGTIGENVACSIYANRPTPCREFPTSGDNDEINPACDRARARYNLAPLLIPVAVS